MLSPVEAFLLGALQGVTEWLPISSSGHLVIAQTALGLSLPLVFDALLHLGTLGVTLAFFRTDVWRILKSATRLDFRSDDGRYVLLILVGTFPTVLIALLFRAFLEPLFYSPKAVALAYLAIAPLLFLSRPRSGRETLNYWDALLIGFFQGVAIAPGISRSGVTIGIGLIRGLSAKTAAKYSFLLSVPSIIGAVALESTAVSVSDPSLSVYLAAMLVAALVGYFSLRLLLRTLTGGRFHLFAYYCATLGLLVLLATSLSTP